MKILIKLTVLFLSLISVAGCGNANTSTSSGASSSSYPLPSLDDSGPAIQSGTKVSAETIQDKTFEEKTFASVRITYNIKETVTGEKPKSFYVDGTPTPDGTTVNTTVVIESKPYSRENQNFTLVSGATSPLTNGINSFRNGQRIDIKGCIDYHKKQEKAANNPKNTIDYKDAYYVEPYGAYSKSVSHYSGTEENIGNASLNGEYIILIEYDQQFNSDGYMTKQQYREVTYINGEITSYAPTRVNSYQGMYTMICEATFEYLYE